MCIRDSIRPVLQNLAALRKSCPAFADGTLAVTQAQGGVLCYERRAEDVYKRQGLGLNSAARSDAGDLGQRQLTRQKHACKTQRGQTARTVYNPCLVYTSRCV